MFQNQFISLALTLIDKYLVSKITYAPLREHVQGLYALLGEVADALTDKDPNNVEQLKEVWEKHDEPTLDGSLLTAAKIIELRVKDEELATVLSGVLRVIAAEELLD